MSQQECKLGVAVSDSQEDRRSGSERHRRHSFKGLKSGRSQRTSVHLLNRGRGPLFPFLPPRRFTGSGSVFVRPVTAAHAATFPPSSFHPPAFVTLCSPERPRPVISVMHPQTRPSPSPPPPSLSTQSRVLHTHAPPTPIHPRTRAHVRIGAAWRSERPGCITLWAKGPDNTSEGSSNADAMAISSRATK